MLDGKFNQQQIVNHRECQHRRVQKRNQEKPGSAQDTGERDDFLFPCAQLTSQKKAPRKSVELTDALTRALEQRLDRFNDYIVNMVQFLGLHHVWRKYIHNIPQRPQKYAALQEEAIQFRTQA